MRINNVVRPSKCAIVMKESPVFLMSAFVNSMPIRLYELPYVHSPAPCQLGPNITGICLHVFTFVNSRSLYG